MQDLINSMSECAQATCSPTMSPQQIVWLEVYKIVIAKKGTTDDDASWAALRAEKAFTNLFGGATP